MRSYATRSAERTETTFSAMGSFAQIIISGGRPELGSWARGRLRQLEAMWSRFEPESEISRLNDATGPVIVSSETIELLARAIEGWERTGGRFDPTVHNAMVANGYDRPIGSDGFGSDGCVDRTSGRSPGCSGISFDPATGLVQRPHGVAIDPGGIGKGLAADILVRELMQQDVNGALVNIGGDLRATGLPVEGDAWEVDIAERAVRPDPIARVRLVDGAVATSTIKRRRWSTAKGERHHLVDPATGDCHNDNVELISVVARDGWWAEVATKQLFGLPIDRWNDDPGLAALAVLADGDVVMTPAMQAIVSAGEVVSGETSAAS